VAIPSQVLLHVLQALLVSGPGVPGGCEALRVRDVRLRCGRLQCTPFPVGPKYLKTLKFLIFPTNLLVLSKVFVYRFISQDKVVSHAISARVVDRDRLE
jgi:hypothetical protein